jgi:hypothetical protein
MLRVGILAGGGFFALHLTPKGVDQIEGALEFGAAMNLDIGLASGRVYIMGGIYFSTSAEAATLCGYVRAGGELKIIGLITMSLEFYLGLSYERRGEDSYAVGEASLTVEIGIAFFSISVKLTVRREFQGSNSSSSKSKRSMIMNRTPAAIAAREEAHVFSNAGSATHSRRSHFTDKQWRQYRSHYAW